MDFFQLEKTEQRRGFKRKIQPAESEEPEVQSITKTSRVLIAENVSSLSKKYYTIIN